MTIRQYAARFRILTAREARHRVAAVRAAGERSQLLEEMHRSGLSYGDIADAVHLSRSRVQQLVERGNVSEP